MRSNGSGTDIKFVEIELNSDNVMIPKENGICYKLPSLEWNFATDPCEGGGCGEHECDYDTDCDFGQVCNLTSYMCEDDESECYYGEEGCRCRDNSDCAGNLFCENGYCAMNDMCSDPGCYCEDDEGCASGICDLNDWVCE